jgi:histidine decarboxylase
MDFDFNINKAGDQVANILRAFEQQLKSRTYLHLGYPYNLDYDYSILKNLIDYSINNLGDPFVESNYGVHSRCFEVAVLEWFANVWGLAKDEYWGYMTACGTEGNLHGIWMGRENMTKTTKTTKTMDKNDQNHSQIALVASKESHYSVWKAARMYCMEPYPINTVSTGEINLIDLENVLHNIKAKGQKVVIVANVGTTIKGAVDDVDGILLALQKQQFASSDFFMHIDGALFGIMLPYIQQQRGEPQTITFAKPGIGSVSVSGHKFLGSPVPCGVVITRNTNIQCLAQDIPYIASRDATILGSRNGHAPIFMWYALVKKGEKGLRQDVKLCIENAHYMRDTLINKGIQDVILNEYSSTVVFRKPNDEHFIKKWQLACNNDVCHVVIMPNVSREKIDIFVDELSRLA